MTFERGSLILVDYTLRIKDADAVIDTTNEDEAHIHSIHDPDRKYGPKLVSIGEVYYPVLKGLQQGLSEMSAGERKTIEVEPEQGWGKRDTSKYRTYSQRKLGKDADRYSVGDPVQIDGKDGVVRFIGSGRIQIDFNHPYAGKTLVYDATVTKHLEETEEVVRAILKNGMDPSVKVHFDDNAVTIRISGGAKETDSSTAKGGVAGAIFKFAPEIEYVYYVEEYVNKDKAPPADSGSAGAGNIGHDHDHDHDHDDDDDYVDDDLLDDDDDDDDEDDLLDDDDDDEDDLLDDDDDDDDDDEDDLLDDDDDDDDDDEDDLLDDDDDDDDDDEDDLLDDDEDEDEDEDDLLDDDDDEDEDDSPTSYKKPA